MFTTPMMTGAIAAAGGGPTEVLFKIWGAGGGGQAWNGDVAGVGGSGGFVQATFTLAAGTSLKIRVGQGGFGGQRANGNNTPSGSGYTGGGQAYSQPDQVSGGGGGGLTGVFTTSVAFANALLVAGAGGGGGGAGGGEPGGGAGLVGVGSWPGQPGTTSAGGAGATTSGNARTAQAGSALTGGDGSNDTSGANRSGGGGGAGYYGGGGGYQAGGGGGANFIHADGTSTTNTNGTTASTSLKTTHPTVNTGDGDYASTVGEGGATGNGSTNGDNGGHGRVVVYVNGVLDTTFTYTGADQTVVVP